MKFSCKKSWLLKVSVCLGALVTAIGTTALVEPAQAELKVCNRSSRTAYIAVAYGVGDDRWRSEGWYEINPNKCEVVIDQPLAAGDYYYLYGGDRGDSWVWEGNTDQNFCVHPTDAFNYVAKGDGCGRNGSELRPFFEVKVDSSSYTMNLTN
ncbi:MAG: DUF1036 domain-containing protein [Pseudanabaenaceae cyanobacterium bins.39]|nr:DUF1036 domain-containing protein [Pseudanabaenaceae cyanobacterium bins.39]